MQTTQSTPDATIQSPSETSGLGTITRSPKYYVFQLSRLLAETVSTSRDLSADKELLLDLLDKQLSWESEIVGDDVIPFPGFLSGTEKAFTPKQSVFFIIQSLLELAECGASMDELRDAIVHRLDRVVSWESQLRDLDDELHEISISHPRIGARYP